MILNIPPRNAAVDLALDSGAVVDLRPPRGGADLTTRQGALWITQTGDPTDHILKAGESFHVEGGRLVVVQALEASRLGFGHP